MKKITTATLLSVLILVLVLQLVPLAVAQTSEEASDNQVELRVVVHVYDVDVGNKLANVSIHFWIVDFPYETDNITVRLLSDENSIITCSIEEESDNGWYYSGETEPILWFLLGTGEPFPFDSYTIRVKITDITSLDTNFTLQNEEHQAFFAGSNAYYLKNIWNANDLAIPNINSNEQSTSFLLKRTWNEVENSILRYYIPTIACYFLLGSALLFNPKDGISNRLKIFLSIFFFVPTYLIGIQEVLPYRTSLSFPEILLINLVTSTAILGVFSAIAHHKASTSEESGKGETGTDKIFSNGPWDGVGLLIALGIFVYFTWRFGNVINPQIGNIISYAIFPSYVFWIPFVDKTIIEFNKTTLYAVVMGICITIITYSISLFLPPPYTIMGIEIGASISGFIVAWYLQRGDKSTIISCLSGILGSLFAGIILGAVFGERLFGADGFSGVGEGFIQLGSIGYFYGVFTVIAGLLAIRLKDYFDSRKEKNQSKKLKNEEEKVPDKILHSEE